MILSEGEPADIMYIIKSGEVMLTKESSLPDPPASSALHSFLLSKQASLPGTDAVGRVSPPPRPSYNTTGPLKPPNHRIARFLFASGMAACQRPISTVEASAGEKLQYTRRT